MFSLRSVCLFVCLFVCPSDKWKSCEQLFTKFLGGVGHGQGTKDFNFGDDPDQSPDPGVRSGSRSGSGKNCHVVNTHRTLRTDVCKNHSAILLCWRSAEVCALFLSTSSYLRRRRLCFYFGLFVCLFACLFICLSVCLFALLRLQFSLDFGETLHRTLGLKK